MFLSDNSRKRIGPYFPKDSPSNTCSERKYNVFFKYVFRRINLRDSGLKEESDLFLYTVDSLDLQLTCIKFCDMSA